jgi:hypothetical protein
MHIGYLKTRYITAVQKYPTRLRYVVIQFAQFALSVFLMHYVSLEGKMSLKGLSSLGSHYRHEADILSVHKKGEFLLLL